MSQTGSKGSVSGIPGLKVQQQTPLKGASMFANTKGRSGKFMSHLLGLDHEPGVSGSAGTAGTGGAAAAKTVKVSDLFHGIRFTPNFMFFLLFVSFFLWLFVIYWVRHHEPLSNQVLGTPKADAKTAQADRQQLVNGTKTAFPVRTSASAGEVFVPGTPQTPPAQDNSSSPSNQPGYSSQFGAASAANMGAAQAPMPVAANQVPALSLPPVAGAGGLPVSIAPSAAIAVPPIIQTAQSAPSGRETYLLENNANAGHPQRVRTIVSR